MLEPRRGGMGKTARVIVFAVGEKAEAAVAAVAAGADEVGSDDLIEKIQGGFLDFDAATKENANCSLQQFFSK